MIKLSKVKTTKEKDRDRIYKQALTGNVFAMIRLRDEFNYTTITIDGKPVNLRRL